MRHLVGLTGWSPAGEKLAGPAKLKVELRVPMSLLLVLALGQILQTVSAVKPGASLSQYFQYPYIQRLRPDSLSAGIPSQGIDRSGYGHFRSALE